MHCREPGVTAEAQAATSVCRRAGMVVLTRGRLASCGSWVDLRPSRRPCWRCCVEGIGCGGKGGRGDDAVAAAMEFKGKKAGQLAQLCTARRENLPAGVVP